VISLSADDVKSEGIENKKVGLAIGDSIVENV